MFMNKRDAKKDNLILFPDLEKRLLEKGLDYLKQKKYKDAIHFLEQALEHDQENSDIYVGLVLAYFEAGYIKQAKQVANDMLRKGLGDYVQVIDLYLMILVQLNEYDEIATTIEALLEEKEIPADKQEHFSRMLDFARRMQGGDADMSSAESLEAESEGAKLSLFNYKDPKDQVMLAAQLAKENIRPYIKEIREYVASEEGHPFQKTMLLNILKEQEYAEEIDVRKFGWERAFVPARLPELKDYISLNGVIPLLSSQVESADPVLYENIMSLMERHFFLIYPFELPNGPLEAWAAAYHYIAKEYYGFEESLETFAKIYRSSYEETEQVLSFIRVLEEISYPII
jgi:tetratricopeptide (TPR) repeat protein